VPPRFASDRMETCKQKVRLNLTKANG